MEGNIDIDAGDGGGLGPFWAPKIPNNLNNLKQIQKTITNLFFSIFFLPEWNFDIDAGDGDWGGRNKPHKSPKHQ